MGEMLNTGRGFPEIGNDLCRREWPAGYPGRFPVPEELVSWEVAYPDYNPYDFDQPRANTVAAKPDDVADPARVNQIDWTRRQTFTGPLRFDKYGYPLNPAGRTGLQGRGMLNAWGATLAAEAIVTRTTPSGQPELLTVTRTANGKVAMPAGKFAVNQQNEIVETAAQTASRELQEETGVQLDFQNAVEVYQGYVDDERNTDNAWMETIGLHQHLPYDIAACLVLQPQPSETTDIGWRLITDDLLDNMHASSGYIVRKALGL